MSSSAEQRFPFRLEFPPELPISARAEEITAAIQAHQVVILAGETGSGKTTQIPKMCLAAGGGARGRIACTQPRRVAALSISRRVAEEVGVEWGRGVGCKVRFSDHTSRGTVIKFLTDGMLLAELQNDPLLREYDTIIIDEAHERSLNIDFLLGHLRTLRFRRPELKIVITSATIDTAAFSAAFDGAPVIVVEGRTFPVEVIYAPLDELGSDYTENDENEERDDVSAVASAKAEALHYVDGTVAAIERIVRESPAGDVLAFLPSERDIREVRDLLEDRLRSLVRGAPASAGLVPLFGRLSNEEQQRVFASTPRRKIVLATNIAETSLTIPGIRFVVDTGLARISRYSPQARTRRLPIEEVAQSSAEQRKGRAGRVAEGVCIRLYSEKDLLERPRFTQPEIQRANLADVILRMKAFGLGDIERFPFINMPATKAIRAGYALLEELGALATRRSGAQGEGDRRQAGSGAMEPASSAMLPAPAVAQLTPLGRELARLPVDPTAGRMILQARTEKALREVIIIAAGLSIQDPRERPLDKQQQADTAHRRFAHPDSDFLTLLNIWDRCHDEFETLSQARRRRFCREHFLSYTRMREWRDIHAQLVEVLEEREDFKMTSALDAVRREGPPSRHQAAPATGKHRRRDEFEPADPLAFGTPAYRAIHRSILSGLLGNIAQLDEENGGYKATHDRRVVLFPGSVLFQRESPKRTDPTRKASPRPGDAGKRTPRWIMAAEIVETTRLYARTCARLDPLWAFELGSHLIRVSYSEPFWNEPAGRVMVKRRSRLYGLELERRAVGYGRIDPGHATEIFIREGLVNDTIRFPLDFLAHNRTVRGKIEDLLTRARDSGCLNLDEAAYRFYAARLMPETDAAATGSGDDAVPPAVARGGSAAPVRIGVSSVAELVDLMRERRDVEPRFLFMAPEDLRDPETIVHDTADFPEALPLENRALPLDYAYKPGEPEDGVTVTVGAAEAETLTPAALDWAVPGHLEPKVEHFLRALPKELRRGFVPLGDTAKLLAEELRGAGRANVGMTPLPPPPDGEAPRYANMPLPEALAAAIAVRFRVAIDPAVWADKPAPEHLRVRIRVVDQQDRELCASRDLGEIHAALLAQSREASLTIAREEPAAWRAARARWETAARATWAFEALPDRVLVAEQGGTPVYAFPGLRAGTDGVARRLFKTLEQADAATREAVAWLLEQHLGRDLMWTERDLRSLRALGPLATTLAPVETLQEHAFATIRRWVTDPARILTARARGASAETEGIRGHVTAGAFAAAVGKAQADLRGLAPRLADLLRESLSLRQELLLVSDPPPGMQAALAALMPPDFMAATPYEQLGHFPRYLKAMKLRAGRWRKSPAKDSERSAQIAPYEKAAVQLRPPPRTAPNLPAKGGAAAEPFGGGPAFAASIEAFRWLIEEFRVSLFAQELGTAAPVSAVKLDRALLALRAQERPVEAAVPASSRQIVAVPVTDKTRKAAPLKNLGGLDRLFQR